MLPFSAVVQTVRLRSAGKSAASSRSVESTVKEKSAASVFWGMSAVQISTAPDAPCKSLSGVKETTA